MAGSWKGRDLAHGKPLSYAELSEGGYLDADASFDAYAEECAGCGEPLAPGYMERSPGRGALVCSGGMCAAAADHAVPDRSWEDSAESGSFTEPDPPTEFSRMCPCGSMVLARANRLCCGGMTDCMRFVCDSCPLDEEGRCPACAASDVPDPIPDPVPVSGAENACRMCKRVSTDRHYVEFTGCSVCQVCPECVPKRPRGVSHVCPDAVCADTLCLGCLSHSPTTGSLPQLCDACVTVLESKTISPLEHNWTHVGATSAKHRELINRIHFYAHYRGAVHPSLYSIEKAQRRENGLAPLDPLPPLPVHAPKDQRTLAEYTVRMLVLRPPTTS